jgi:hypothetical protein
VEWRADSSRSQLSANSWRGRHPSSDAARFQFIRVAFFGSRFALNSIGFFAAAHGVSAPVAGNGNMIR